MTDLTKWVSGRKTLSINLADQEDIPGTDTGFPVGGGTNPPGGRQHMILPKFPKNCMKLRKFWAVGGGGHSVLDQLFNIVIETKLNV